MFEGFKWKWISREANDFLHTPWCIVFWPRGNGFCLHKSFKPISCGGSVLTMHKVILSYSCAASYSLIRSVIMTMWNDYSAAEEGVVPVESDISGRQTVSVLLVWFQRRSPIIRLLKNQYDFCLSLCCLTRALLILVSVSDAAAWASVCVNNDFLQLVVCFHPSQTLFWVYDSDTKEHFWHLRTEITRDHTLNTESICATPDIFHFLPPSTSTPPRFKDKDCTFLSTAVTSRLNFRSRLTLVSGSHLVSDPFPVLVIVCSSLMCLPCV